MADFPGSHQALSQTASTDLTALETTYLRETPKSPVEPLSEVLEHYLEESENHFGQKHFDSSTLEQHKDAEGRT